MSANSVPQALANRQGFHIQPSTIPPCFTFSSSERKGRSSWACKTATRTHSVTVRSRLCISRICALRQAGHWVDTMSSCWTLQWTPFMATDYTGHTPPGHLSWPNISPLFDWMLLLLGSGVVSLTPPDKNTTPHNICITQCCYSCRTPESKLLSCVVETQSVLWASKGRLSSFFFHT